MKLSPTGAVARLDHRGPTTAFSFPLGVSVEGNKVYVGDTGRHRVVVLDRDARRGPDRRSPTAPARTSTTTATPQADSAGNIYVAGYKTNEILKFAPDGTCLGKWGGTGTTPGKFRTPYGVDIAVDPVTGQELVYVADGLNNRVQVFTTAGTFVTQFGTLRRARPGGHVHHHAPRVAVAKDGSGDVWAADLWGNRVERWRRTPTGFAYASTIGAVMPEPTATAIFHEPRGMAFTPERRPVGHRHRAPRVRPVRQPTATCSAPAGSAPPRARQLGQFNWPRGIAVDPGDRQPVDRGHQAAPAPGAEPRPAPGIGFVQEQARPAPTPGPSTGPTTSPSADSDRFAFVVDTQNHRIKAYDVAHATFGPPTTRDRCRRTSSARAGTGSSELPVAQRRRRRTGRARLRRRPRQQPDPGAPSPSTASPPALHAGGTLDGPRGRGRRHRPGHRRGQQGRPEVVMAPTARSSDRHGLHHPSAVEVGPTAPSSSPTPTPTSSAPTRSARPAAGHDAPTGAIELRANARCRRRGRPSGPRRTTRPSLRCTSRCAATHPPGCGNGTYGPAVGAGTWPARARRRHWSPRHLPATGGYFVQLRSTTRRQPERARSRSAFTASPPATRRPDRTITAPPQAR